MPCGLYITSGLGQCNWEWEHSAGTPPLKHPPVTGTEIPWHEKVSDCIYFNFFFHAVHMSEWKE